MTTSQDNVSAKREIDLLTSAFFSAVSFKEGEKPDYQNLYQIFIESGQFFKNISGSPEISTVSQFIEPRQKLIAAGELTSFRETEMAEITEIFGNIAHRFSHYEKSGRSAGSEIVGRGIISLQFVMTGNGWRISSMAWDDERAGLTIPDRYK
jgi:hypothetical protein